MALDTTLLDLEKKADDFMHTAVGTMLDVMQYDQLAGIVQDFSAAEDFNPHLYPNFRAQDHNKKWYHTDSEIQVEYCPDPESKLPPERTEVNPERIAIFNLMAEDYWNTLDDTEKKIHRLTDYGYTQKEIAEKLGYAGNSTVLKRLQKCAESSMTRRESKNFFRNFRNPGIFFLSHLVVTVQQIVDTSEKN